MIRFIRSNKLIKKPISHQKDKYKEVILQEGEIPGLLQFARSKFKKDDEIAGHFHESMIEVFYILNGEVSVSDGNKKSIVKKGDTFVVYPLQEHSLKFNEESELIYFNVRQI